jgi:DNA-binding MarR family transcriptional regulator
MRKTAGRTKLRVAKKTPGRQKSAGPRKSARTRRTAAATAPLPGSLPPPPGQGKRGEAGYLGYLLRQAAAAARLRLERALAGLGATPPQFLVLTMLKAYPGLSGADLARVAVLTPQTVGVIIRNLERDGAIRKTPHPVHGRVLQWSLTRRGLTLLGKCRRHALVLERRLAAGLNRREERAVRRWLSNIALILQA